VPQNHWVEEDVILIKTSCEIGREAYVLARGVRFNVTGAAADEPAEFATALEASYEPVNATDRVEVDAGDPVEAHAPLLGVTETTVEENTTNTTGNGTARLTIADDVGGLMGDGSRLTVELDDTGVTFNESQEFETVAVEGDSPPPTVLEVDETSIVLEVEDETTAGDEFRIQRAGGEGIRFDAAPGANDTAFTVATTPGDEDVTQVTDTVVSVGCLPETEVKNVIDADNNNDINLSELLEAASYYNDDEVVPGTCKGIPLNDDQQTDLLDLAGVYNDDSKGVDEL
jgi:hypothetical protein